MSNKPRMSHDHPVPGVINAYDIAKASDRMAGLIFGIADFAASMGVRENVNNQNQNFHYAKQATVVAAKAGGLHGIDNAWLRLVRNDTYEEESNEVFAGLREKNEGSRDLGMDGTWVIHTQQAKGAIEYYHEVGGGSLIYPFIDVPELDEVFVERSWHVADGRIRVQLPIS